MPARRTNPKGYQRAHELRKDPTSAKRPKWYMESGKLYKCVTSAPPVPASQKDLLAYAQN